MSAREDGIDIVSLEQEAEEELAEVPVSSPKPKKRKRRKMPGKGRGWGKEPIAPLPDWMSDRSLLPMKPPGK